MLTFEKMGIRLRQQFLSPLFFCKAREIGTTCICGLFTKQQMYSLSMYDCELVSVVYQRMDPWLHADEMLEGPSEMILEAPLWEWDKEIAEC